MTIDDRDPPAGRPTNDLDVAAHFGGRAPASWEVPLPGPVDLLVLDLAPLSLAGRVALRGRLLFEDDPVARVRWIRTIAAAHDLVRDSLALDAAK